MGRAGVARLGGILFGLASCAGATTPVERSHRAPPAVASAPSDARSSEGSEGFVEVPGGRLAFVERGSGPALVLLHDGLLPSTTWEEVLPRLAEHFHVLAYDRRGNGRSPISTEPWSEVDDLEAFLVAHGVSRTALVGSSAGGELALDYTLAHPERVEGLVLVGPVVGGFPFTAHFRARGLRCWKPLMLSDDVERTVALWSEDPWLVAPGHDAARTRLRERLAANAVGLRGAGPTPLPPARPALPSLGEVHVPALLLVGAGDIPDVHAHVGAIEAALPRATRVVVDDAGHLVQLERPELFADVVLEFLAPEIAARAYLAERAARPRAGLPPPDLAYDRAAALDVEELGVAERGAARVVDLAYASPRGGRVTAFLVLPLGESAPGSRPALLFLHPGQGDRSTFLDEGVELAGAGFVSLLIDAPGARPAPWAPPPTVFDPAADRAVSEATVVDLERGLDLLAARPEVDPERLGYVGHSLGATLGGVLLGRDPRVRASVLMAGLPALSHALAAGRLRGAAGFQALLAPEAQRAYEATLFPLDAVEFVGNRPPRPLLFQFAWRDEYIARLDAALFALAAGEPSETRWYETDHAFDRAARAERVAWLVANLGAP